VKPRNASSEGAGTGMAEELSDYSTQPELAVAALIRMLARFPISGPAAMTASIARHLDVIAADTRLPEAIRRAALLAGCDWSAVQRETGGHAAPRTLN